MEFKISQYNRQGTDELLKNANKEIEILDSTTRDGEQAGVTYNLDEKIQIIQAVDEAGVNEIQISSLNNKKNIHDAEIISQIPLKKSHLQIMSRATAKTWCEEIEGIAKLKAYSMHSLVPVSTFLRGAYGPALEDKLLIERAVQVVEHSIECGIGHINMSMLDVTRTDLKLLEEMTRAVCAAGATKVCVADTVGCASPEGIYYLTSLFRRWIDESSNGRKVKLGVHIHNDFGVGLANAFQAVFAGADVIDCCINSMGKRAGNVDTAQFHFGLKAFYGIKTSIDEPALYKACKLVEKLSNVPIPCNAPFIGEMVFADDSPSHIYGASLNPFAFQAIDPEGWGEGRKIIINSKSTDQTMRIKLDKMGIPCEDDSKIHEILTACQEAEKALPNGQYITDDIIREICLQAGI